MKKKSYSIKNERKFYFYNAQSKSPHQAWTPRLLSLLLKSQSEGLTEVRTPRQSHKIMRGCLQQLSKYRRVGCLYSCHRPVLLFLLFLLSSSNVCILCSACLILIHCFVTNRDCVVCVHPTFLSESKTRYSFDPLSDVERMDQSCVAEGVHLTHSHASKYICVGPHYSPVLL